MSGRASRSVPRMMSTKGMKASPDGATEICQHSDDRTTVTMPTPSSQAYQRRAPGAHIDAPTTTAISPKRTAPTVPGIVIAAPAVFSVSVNRTSWELARSPNRTVATAPTPARMAPARRSRVQNRSGSATTTSSYVNAVIRPSPASRQCGLDLAAPGLAQPEDGLDHRRRGDEQDDQCLQHEAQLKRDSRVRLHPLAARVQRAEEDRGQDDAPRPHPAEQ